jgi:hypothetical protein
MASSKKRGRPRKEYFILNELDVEQHFKDVGSSNWGFQDYLSGKSCSTIKEYNQLRNTYAAEMYKIKKSPL